MMRFINKILDVPKLVRRIWLLLWFLLIILCFGIWYPVISNNKVFNDICTYIDNRRWLFKTIMLLFYILNFNVVFLTNIGQKWYSKLKCILYVNLLCIANFILKDFNNGVGLILEILFLVIIPIIINVKFKNFKNNKVNVLLPIMIYVIVNVWQLSIYLVRGLDLQLLSSMPLLIYLILQIDYYVFTIITWIGVSFMGIGGIGWLWSKDITVLKAEKSKELKKAKPNMKKVESLDLKITELEKEGM